MDKRADLLKKLQAELDRRTQIENEAVRLMEKEDQKKHAELFSGELVAELAKMKGADIAPHLSCNFDVLKSEYNILLRFPAGFYKTNPIISDIE